jgi:hypothetical protein
MASGQPVKKQAKTLNHQGFSKSAVECAAAVGRAAPGP